MGAIWAIASKDLRLLWRDRMGLFWALVFPLLVALFFGVMASGQGRTRAKLRVAVDDQDASTASRQLVDLLAGSDALAVERLPLAEARAEVVKGDLVAYVVIPRGFGAAGLGLGEAGPPPPLEVGLDPARRAEAGVLQGLLLTRTFAALAAADPEAARALAPLRAERLRQVEVRPQGARPGSAFEVTFPAGILWGIIGCVGTFAVSMVVERTRGTYARLRVAPLSRAHVLAGKALACFLACAGVVALLIAFAAAVFGVRVQSPAMLVVATVCTSLCFVGLMMLFSVIGKTESGVAGFSWGAFIPMSMIGGGMIPLVAMPAWMLKVSSVSPVKWGIVALEGAIWRGYGPGDMLLPCGVLLAVGAVGFTVGARVFARSDA